MYTIEQKGDNVFTLLKDGTPMGDFLTLADAQKAKGLAETADQPKTGTWADHGDGTDYPVGADTSYHSGDWETKHLSLEDRFDAFLKWMKTSHGFHVPAEIAPKE
jgi:hypothetical protein